MKDGFKSGGRVGGVFNCAICGRRTRHVKQSVYEYCPQCDEIGGIENSITDGCYDGDAEGLQQAESRIVELEKQIRAKGGKLAGDAQEEAKP
ncbi:hypothetical protein H8I91_09495 [Serratia fonticola]|uniref:hypothetical protein n=1 Tax=Serratia fonticola TaxID=47917 RepID=UPI0016478929|nr:hypothetical protein [Serratia fonticola]MBC3250496.1 hypothetical protein [Serratia fonticola]